MKQFSLFSGQARNFHGGELALGRRKSLRPLARRRPIHLVLKARRRILPEQRWFQVEVRRLAEKFSLKIHRLVVATNHVHLVVEIPGRREYSAFIRSLTAQAARRLGRGLWSLTPFTRVATWGRDFHALLEYLRKNLEETNGIRDYEPRKDWYARFRSR